MGAHVVLYYKDGTVKNRALTDDEVRDGVVRYDKKAGRINEVQILTEGFGDVVNHPSHYTRGKIEVADFIDDQRLDWKEASIIQYVCRWRMKNGVEDLRKARWYIDRIIEQEEAKGELK